MQNDREAGRRQQSRRGAEGSAARHSLDRDLIEIAPIGFCALQAGGCVAASNLMAAEMLGVPRDRLLGQSLAGLLPAASQPGFRRWLEGTMACALDEPFEAELPGDPSRWVEFTALVADGQESCQVTMVDVTARKQAEALAQHHQQVLQRLTTILQHSAASLQEFLDFALQQAIELTESRLGYLYFYDEERREFTLNSWSRDVMLECTITDPQTCYELDKTGLWGEAVRQRRPLLVNDFQAEHPLKRGYPEGHAVLYKYLTVPLFSEQRIVAVVGVANKDDDYDQTDILKLRLLMDGVWKVVERRRAEDALRATEEKLSVAFQASPDAVFLTSAPRGRIVAVNQAACLLCDAGEEALLGRTAHDLSLWAEEGERAGYAALLERGELVRNYPATFRTSTGDVRHVLLSGRAVTIGDEALQLHVVRDVTERQQLVEQLAESTARLRGLIAAIPDPVWLKDPDGVFLCCNPAFERLYGVPEAEIVGQNDYQFVEPELADFFRAHDRAAAAAGAPTRNEEWLTFRADGYRGLFETVKTPLYNDRGELLGVLGIARDITDRKRVEDELRSSRNLLERIFEILPIGLWIADGRGTLLRGNPAGARIWGAEPTVPLEEYGILRARRLPSGEPVEPDDWALAHTIREGRTITDELLEIDTFDGQQRTISNSSAPVLDSEGRVEYAVVVNVDVTEQRRDAELLEAQLAELRRWHEVTMGRELRVLELKREVNELLRQRGEPPRYPSVEHDP